MKETMGEIIRRLRKERDLTQEELAEQLHISAQAVSKWEMGLCSPDVSQIVPISNLFGVSTDVLFGVQNIDRDKEVKRIIEEASAPCRLHGTAEERFQAAVHEYDAYLDGLKQYPNSIPLLRSALGSAVCLADEYSDRGDRKRARELCEEAIRHANNILRSSTDVSELTHTYWWLVNICCKMGDYQKAEDYASNLPENIETAGIVTANIKKWRRDLDGEMERRCCNISELLFTLSLEIISLGHTYLCKGEIEDALRVYKAVDELIPVIYGDEEYTPPLHGINIGERIALCYVKTGDYDKAVEWLEKSVEKISKDAAHYNKQEHVETPLLRARSFRFFGESMHVKDYINLERPEFAPLRDIPAYRALVERVNNEN